MFYRGHWQTIYLICLIILILLASCSLHKPAAKFASYPHTSPDALVNLPWAKYGHDFGQVPIWGYHGVSVNSELEGQFEKLSNDGIKFVVWHMFGDGRSLVDFDSTDISIAFDNKFNADYEQALRLARKYDIGIIWVLIDFTWFDSEERAEVISDRSRREAFFQNILVPLLKRYKHEPHINGWILINEPENAIKEGKISKDAVYDFVDEAAGLIKRYTDDQPVTVASKSIESLAYLWSGHNAPLDFFIFHHYTQALPPPVTWLEEKVPSIRNKNVFVGEFYISRLSTDIHKFIEWLWFLGYPGAWPWSMNADDSDVFEQKAEEYVEAVQEIKNKSIQDLNLITSLRNRPLSELTERQRNILRGFIQQIETMQCVLDQNICDWETDLTRQKNASIVNSDWYERTQQDIDDQNAQLQQYKAELNEAVASLDQNNSRAEKVIRKIRSITENRDGSIVNELLKAENADLASIKEDIQESTKWRNNLQSVIDEKNETLKKLDRELHKAKAALDQTTALVDWDSFNLKFARQMKLEYLHREITWLNSAGINAEGHQGECMQDLIKHKEADTHL